MTQHRLALFRGCLARVGKINFVVAAVSEVKLIPLFLCKGIHQMQRLRLVIIGTEVHTLPFTPA